MKPIDLFMAVFWRVVKNLTTATRSSMGASLSDVTKWAGAIRGNDGRIYCVPFNAADFLVIDTVTNSATRTALNAS